MKISELARTCGVSADTIRYYERQGLLPAPTRSDNRYRRYSPSDAERLAFIRLGRSLDMTLQEIRALLQWRDQPDANCQSINELLDAHIARIDTRIRQLRTLQHELQALRARCPQAVSTAQCGILDGMTARARQCAA